MRFSIISLTSLSLIGLSLGAATPVEFAPQCGTTLYPTIVQQIYESRPLTHFGNMGNFYVSQEADAATGKVSDRRYTIVAFQGIPADSYGCQLNVKLLDGYPIATSGTPTVSVKTLFSGDSNKITIPNYWTWNKFYPEPSPSFGQSVLGTATFTPGMSSTISYEACPSGGGNLAFVFEIANSVSANASVQFKQTNNGSLYLTYNC